MSVYIKGIDVPKEGTVIVIDSTGQVWSNEWPTRGYTRIDGAKAVPVPEHGRLGDLDDFAKRMKNLVEKAENDGFDLGAAWYSAFVRHIELTPTIIPADKGEEG